MLQGVTVDTPGAFKIKIVLQKHSKRSTHAECRNSQHTLNTYNYQKNALDTRNQVSPQMVLLFLPFQRWYSSAPTFRNAKQKTSLQLWILEILTYMEAKHTQNALLLGPINSKVPNEARQILVFQEGPSTIP